MLGTSDGMVLNGYCGNQVALCLSVADCLAVRGNVHLPVIGKGSQFISGIAIDRVMAIPKTRCSRQRRQAPPAYSPVGNCGVRIGVAG